MAIATAILKHREKYTSESQLLPLKRFKRNNRWVIISCKINLYLKN